MIYIKAKVNEDACIGCGACQSIVSEVFEIGDDGLAKVKVENIKKELESDVQEASDCCPTGAIEVE